MLSTTKSLATKKGRKEIAVMGEGCELAASELGQLFCEPYTTVTSKRKADWALYKSRITCYRLPKGLANQWKGMRFEISEFNEVSHLEWTECRTKHR